MPQRTAIVVPIHGIFPDAAGGTGTFTGTFSITSFVRDAEQLVAVGTLAGTLVDSLGLPLAGMAREVVRLSVDLAAAHGRGELGPHRVELVGQQVELSRVVLGITGSHPGRLPPSLASSPQ